MSRRRSNKDREIGRALLEWYGAGHRDLPWRQTRDPYAIWVSEVMLQQTQVSTVIPYYERFMARFPTVASLAAAPEDEVLRLWAGLGYYSRARNLQRGAREVMARHSGRMPEAVEELLRLPGVGRYSAGAIASIAFDRPAPILDGNVLRVLCRLYGLRGDPKRAPLQARLWGLAEALIPEGQAGAFNQALMELGATVCTPASPRCVACPVSSLCEARRLGLQERLPELARAALPTPLRMAAAVVWRDSEVLLVKRPPAVRAGDRSPASSGVTDRGQVPACGWWLGMWQFPTGEVGAEETAPAAAVRLAREAAGLEVRVDALAGVVRHGVTRWRITLEAWHCHLSDGDALAAADRCWTPLEETVHLALPAPHRRLVEQIRRQTASGAPQADQQPLPEV